MNDDHTVKEEVSKTMGCQNDTLKYLGNNIVSYTLYHITPEDAPSGEDSGEHLETQEFRIVWNTEDNVYEMWSEGGPSILPPPTITELTSI